MKIVLGPACAPGGGHAVRCLALARALQAEGVECAFVVFPLGADLLGRIGWTGATTITHVQAAEIAALKPDAVVMDDYDIDAAFEARLPGVVMVIDDLADRPHACSLLLDSAYGRTPADYRCLAPGAELLLGPDYALLRDGFAAPGREPADQVKRVFLCFGLSDVGGIAARAVEILRPLAPDAVFEVALAADAPSVAALQARKDVTLHLDADVAPLMHAADLGVGAGGGMVWERRAAGLPQLVVMLADNQRPMARRLAEDGVIKEVDLDGKAFKSRLAEAFVALLDPAARRAQIDNPNARCDGQGAARAARALLAAVTGRR